MNTQSIGGWLQILGNFGLVAGLILVGLQIQQNSEIATADLSSRFHEISAQYWISMMGENPAEVWAKAATEPADLTPQDLVVLNAYTNFWFEVHARDQLLLEYDLIEDQREYFLP